MKTVSTKKIIIVPETRFSELGWKENKSKQNVILLWIYFILTSVLDFWVIIWKIEIGEKLNAKCAIRVDSPEKFSKFDRFESAGTFEEQTSIW